MKLTEPVGNTLYAPFFIRCALGAYLLLAGLLKLDSLDGFVVQVQQLGVLPKHIATVVGILLPYLEIVSGTMLILGMWTTLGAIIACILLGAFIYVFGIFPNRGHLFNKDVILFAAGLSIMYSGAGAFSVDRFRKQG
ncbi:MAG: DoxX family protein [Bdellovibrionales bacterium]|nr:DoxX family protein [Bdellovibrionales bacterium]